MPRPLGNLLLARLPEPARDRLTRRACRVCVRAREVLCDAEEPLRHAYFPATGLLASVIPLPDGMVVAAAMIGREGMAGVRLLGGEGVSPFRVIQQVGGESIRVPAEDISEAIAGSPEVRDLVQRYVQAKLQEYAQNAACNVHHTVRERMCRWTLSAADRTGWDEFPMTREFLSEMLGVTRQTVSEAAASLERAGLVSFAGRRLRVLDRAALGRAACDCYRAVSEAYTRTMGFSPAEPGRR